MQKMCQTGKKRWEAMDVISLILMTLITLCIFIPFYNSIVISFSTSGSYLRNPFAFWPSEGTLANYTKVLKNGTSDSRKDWFAVGDYKKLPNEVGGRDTALPEKVADKMKALLTEYSTKEEKTFEDILDFHVKFERIHPFQDGNGRVGRLIMFKECLKYNIVPFIIEDDLKMFYYRGLKEWDNEKGYLTDTCLTAQDKYKAYLDYFRIAY